MTAAISVMVTVVDTEMTTTVLVRLVCPKREWRCVKRFVTTLDCINQPHGVTSWEPSHLFLAGPAARRARAVIRVCAM